jgi:flagellar basal-body rod protein FlgG
VRQPGAQSSQNTQMPSGLMLGTGVRTVATEKLFTQGNVVETGNPLDTAINGRGFFQVLLPDGAIAYSRDGSFQLDSDGNIVTAMGMPLQPGLTVPSETVSLTVGADGTVSALVSGTSAPTQIGTLQLADFINPTGLQAMGENLFSETASSGPPQTGTPGQSGLGLLVQGSLESSNVNVVEELVNMIETQRAYEMNSKAIATTDQMLQFATNNL